MKKYGMLFFLFIGLCGAQDSYAQDQKFAEEALQRGLTAAGQKDWQTAIRYFRDAQEADNYNAQALFNLGLANEMAGNEVPAIAWLQAYLAVSPQAKNRPEVEKEIVNLGVQAEAKSRKLFVAAEEAFRALPEERRSAYYIAGFVDNYARVGLVDEALQTATALGAKNDYSRAKALEVYAGSLASAGDVAAALEICGKNPEISKGTVYSHLSDYYANGGYDLAEAQRYAEMVSESGRDSVFSTLVRELAEAGNYEQAVKYIPRMSEFAAAFKFGAWLEVARAQAKAGKTGDAEKSIAAATALAGTEDYNLADVGRAYVEIKNLDAAKAMIDKISGKNEVLKDRLRALIAEELLKQNKTGPAKTMAANVSNTEELFDYYLAAGELDKAEKIAFAIASRDNFWPGMVQSAFGRLVAVKFKDKKDFSASEVTQGLPFKTDYEKQYFFKYLSFFLIKQERPEQALLAFSFIKIRDPFFMEMALWEIIDYYLGKGDLEQAGRLLERYNDCFYDKLYLNTWFRRWLKYSDACIEAGKTGDLPRRLQLAKAVALGAGAGIFVRELDKCLAQVKADTSRKAVEPQAWVSLARNFSNNALLSNLDQHLAGIKINSAEYVPGAIASAAGSLISYRQSIDRLKGELRHK